MHRDNYTINIVIVDTVKYAADKPSSLRFFSRAAAISCLNHCPNFDHCVQDVGLLEELLLPPWLPLDILHTISLPTANAANNLITM